MLDHSLDWDIAVKRETNYTIISHNYNQYITKYIYNMMMSWNENIFRIAGHW